MENKLIMASSIHFVNTSSSVGEELINSESFIQESIDPLQDIGNGIQQNYYRIDSSVFAEPFEIKCKGNNSHKDDREAVASKEDDTMVIDNVIVQKRKGRKYKKYHISIEDSSELICPQSNCNRKFSSTKLLMAHIRKVHCTDKTSYMCDECGRAFSCRYLLVRHTAVHERRTLQCSVCAVVLSERTSLSAHMRTHSGIKPYCCPVCNKQFTRKSTRDTHVKFVHRRGQLECDKCHERFETRSQWTRHTSTHHRTHKQDGTSN